MACADNEVIAVAADFDVVVVDIAMVVFVLVFAVVVADAVEIVDPSS